MQTLTAADINNIGIRDSDCDAADRARGLVVKDGRPGVAIVVCFPDPTIHLGDIENIWLRRHARDGSGPAPAKRSNAAPMKRLQQVLTDLLRADNRANGDYEGQHEHRWESKA